MTDKEFIEGAEPEKNLAFVAAEEVPQKSAFEILNSVNVNGHTEGRNDLTYLSWVWAIAEVMKRYPDMEYEVMKFDGLPYVYDEKTGYMVYTKVTIQGITHEMWLPVMDSSNKAMKNVPYTYRVKNKNFKYATLNEKDGKYYDKYGNEQKEFEEKTVEAATMFDVNKTIMRCLTKNLAMFGLGLYIYAGEDLPEAEKEDAKEKVIKGMKDELKALWDKAGGKEGFEEWVAKNTEKKSLEEMFGEMKTSLTKKINEKLEGKK